MTLETFINHIKNNQAVKFDETMSVIADNYNYQATEFSNGLFVPALYVLFLCAEFKVVKGGHAALEIF